MKKDTVCKILTLILVVCLLSIIFPLIKSEPEGATVQFISNSTKNSTTAQSRNDTKGTISTVILTTIQQNSKWKAYVGNVSGTLVLRDADSYSIYEWASGGSPDGRVFMTRNSTINWDTIRCANDTSVTFEQNELSHSSTAADNINNTFSYRIHKSFPVGEVTITNSTCKSLATWVNNTAQSMTENALFEEVLLMDLNYRMVYTTIIDQNTRGYRNDNVTIYDFQAIVPDYTTTTTALYYFYVEISG